MDKIEKERPLDISSEIRSNARKELLRGAILVVILAGVFWGISAMVGQERLVRIVEEAGPVGPFVFVLAKASTIVLAPLSGWPLYLLAGGAYGLWQGVALSLMGDLLGGILAFSLSRHFGRAVLLKFVGPTMIRMVEYLRESRAGSWQGLVVCRLTLVGLQDIVSFAYGLTKIPIGLFIAITAVFSLPHLILAVGVGAAIIGTQSNKAGVIFIVVIGLLVAGIMWFISSLTGPRSDPKEKNRGIFQ